MYSSVPVPHDQPSHAAEPDATTPVPDHQPPDAAKLDATTPVPVHQPPDEPQDTIINPVKQPVGPLAKKQCTTNCAPVTPHQMKPCDPFHDVGPWAILHPLSIMSHFIKQTEEFNVSHGSDGRAKLITRKIIEAGPRLYPPQTIPYRHKS